MKAHFLIGRVIFDGFFLYNGINHFKNRQMLAQCTASENVPKPDIAVTATGAMMLIGGTSINLGIKSKWGALALLGFLGGISPVVHDFWRSEDPNRPQEDMIHFAKNVALMGAVLALMGVGVEESWPVSVPVAQPGIGDQLKRAWDRNAAA